MYTIGEIKDSINALSISDSYKKQVTGKSEIKELPNIIRDGELIKDIVMGIYGSVNFLVGFSTSQILPLRYSSGRCGSCPAA